MNPLKALASFALIVSASVSLALASSASAHLRHTYATETDAEHAIEQQGWWYPSGRRMLVDTAVCIGLRRDGVKDVTQYDEGFVHLKCSLDTSSGHVYTAIYHSLPRYYWKLTNLKLMY